MVFFDGRGVAYSYESTVPVPALASRGGCCNFSLDDARSSVDHGMGLWSLDGSKGAGTVDSYE